jgi:hypothetical protein
MVCCDYDLSMQIAGSGLVAFAAALGAMPLDLQPGVTLLDVVNAIPYMAKNAQRAKKVKLHFKPLLCQAFSNLTGQLSSVQNLIPYLDFMHYESCKGSRNELPGSELILPGLEDLYHGRNNTIGSLLISLAKPL